MFANNLEIYPQSKRIKYRHHLDLRKTKFIFLMTFCCFLFDDTSFLMTTTQVWTRLKKLRTIINKIMETELRTENIFCHISLSLRQYTTLKIQILGNLIF